MATKIDPRVIILELVRALTQAEEDTTSAARVLDSVSAKISSWRMALLSLREEIDAVPDAAAEVDSRADARSRRTSARPKVERQANKHGHQELKRVRQAAEQLTFTEKGIWNWISQGRIGVVRIGRSVRIPQSEIDRLISEGYREAGLAEPDSI